MITKDDRTEEQKKTHYLAVVMKDKFLSKAKGGASRCAWAFDHSKVNSDGVENWVRNRSDASYVNLIDLRTYRAPRGTADFHVYVCEQDHPAAKY